MKVIALIFVAMLCVSPATAQAPTLDQRVADLEARVDFLEGALGCFGKAMAISKEPAPGDHFYMTRSADDRHVYVSLVNRNCLGGTDDYTWRGYRDP